MKYFTFSFLLCFVCFKAAGQDASDFFLVVFTQSGEGVYVSDSIDMEKEEVGPYLERELSRLRRNHPLANLDSLICFDRFCRAYIHVGAQLTENRILVDSADAMLVETQVLRKMNKNQPLDSIWVEAFHLRLQRYLADQGYPFARSEFDSLIVGDETLRLRLKLQRNRKVYFDSIRLVGSVGLSKKFLFRHLGIQHGMPYQHQKVLALKSRINDLRFVECKSDPYVLFYPEGAVIGLELAERKISIFDFLIGIFPGRTNGQRSIQINGEFNADLWNKLGVGENFGVFIKRLSAEDQSMEMKLMVPYVLALPVGLDGRFTLRRNRNISIDVDFEGGGRIAFLNNHRLSFFASLRSSRLITVDTAALITSGRLPRNLDHRFRGGGLEWAKSSLSDAVNPSSGWDIKMYAGFGGREIIINEGIRSLNREGTDFSAAYDSISGTVVQASLNFKADRYIPITNIFVLRTSLRAGGRFTNGPILENEKFRIGGNKLLRGFDELSILTSRYAVIGMELRIRLDRSSFFNFPFIDYAVMHIENDGKKKTDTALGLGGGINFATKSGILNVTLAVGRRNRAAFDFGSTRVHIGYVSLF